MVGITIASTIGPDQVQVGFDGTVGYSGCRWAKQPHASIAPPKLTPSPTANCWADKILRARNDRTHCRDRQAELLATSLTHHEVRGISCDGSDLNPHDIAEGDFIKLGCLAA